MDLHALGTIAQSMRERERERERENTSQLDNKDKREERKNVCMKNA